MQNRAHQMNGIGDKTLTEIEAIGLNSRYDLANGHATHELSISQRAILKKLPSLWQSAAKTKSRAAEWMFQKAFLQLAQTPSLKDYRYFKICPTASNSIDIVAAWLSDKKLRTALIEPTFDNLYLLLKRRGVQLFSLPEEKLVDHDYKEILKFADAIFLVNPNNPTGKVLSIELLHSLIDWCKENNKTIIFDHSFRFFVPPVVDVYQILIESDVNFLSIEDTGKVWPTQEIKASLLFCSESIYNEIDMIYDELFLCHSNFALFLLTEFLNDAHHRGLFSAIWQGVAIRRKKFRNCLDGYILSIEDKSLHSMLSVEWVKINHYFVNDLQFAEHFYQQNLILLPGRQFYWCNKNQVNNQCYIRFALLKPQQVFLLATTHIKRELKRLSL